MIISVVNRTKSIGDEELQGVIRAINQQIERDFEPYWSFGATLRLEGQIGKRTTLEQQPQRHELHARARRALCFEQCARSTA